MRAFLPFLADLGGETEKGEVPNDVRIASVAGAKDLQCFPITGENHLESGTRYLKTGARSDPPCDGKFIDHLANEFWVSASQISSFADGNDFIAAH